MLRLVFMGTAEFAVPGLQAAAEAGHQVLAVVSQPDRPRGRGMKLQPSPVTAEARERGLPVLQPEKASQPEFVASLRDLEPQVIVVVAYGQILRPAVLDLPPLGCINVHGSLLPELRGAAPIQWAIIRGHRETGVTTMFMDAGMDTGDMILKAAVPIAPGETAGELSRRLAPLGANLLVETLARVEAGTAPRTPQDDTAATYAPMLKKEDGVIDWKLPAAQICNRIHGCNPMPGASTEREGHTVRLWRAQPLPTDDAAPRKPPGTVLEGEGVVLAAGEGRVRLVEVQPENRGRMSGEAFRHGYHVTPGERWGSDAGAPTLEL
jgi:methionyl-tRNA formyltransferase